MSIESIWEPDINAELENVYKSMKISHPGVAYIINKGKPICIGGEIEKLLMPTHHDYRHYSYHQIE